MKNKIITITTVALTALLLAACTQSTPAPETQSTQPSPTAAMMQPDASISGQIDISDDAVTAREATMSSSPKASSKSMMKGNEDSSY